MSPIVYATKAIVGRQVMVTRQDGSPWYLGEATSVTSDGQFVEVKGEVTKRKGWLWKREVTEPEWEWHKLSDVHLVAQ